MVINADGAKALEAGDEKALAAALKGDYGDAADWLSKKLLGLLPDDDAVIE